ncbi:hypothetical protein [Nocardia asteroides]|uniref:hypothetical protein n=1 Tax=Nocardia asteroides TaxID=1824 RepID=UPI00340A27D8
MTKFRVIGVFPVSFWPDPFLIGLPDGEIQIGDEATLKRTSESYQGVVQRIEFHQPSPEKLSISISGALANEVREGDLIFIGSDEDKIC